MLSVRAEIIRYQGDASIHLNPQHLFGKGTEMDIGYQWFGLSYSWAGNDYLKSPYTGVTLSGSWGMDYGAAIWETETMLIPLQFFLYKLLWPIGFGLILDFLKE